ncbi:glutamate/gamma-aminobutyrate family transporter YjeM [Cellulosilyticum ruminicola]|uniref:glutamate/gamma-aminobutyrate family transporter YjeM n=1 Tax=Cellulosilyticum ruminicola TaxID=425254 RepID=UPI000AACD3FB|nr:glutamate/gamma-aminobutyrate family transporter YjeM [Cellulosilyticum ruminicola]
MVYLGAIAFFLPYAFMMAEYGAAYKQEKGGIFSWMESAVGTKYAFIGTFMWYASYLVWQVNVSSTIWIPLSNAIFGEDRTGSLGIWGLNSTQVLGILGVLLIIVVTFVSSKGVSAIQKVTSIGGSAIMLLNVLLIGGGFVVLFMKGGQFAQPIIEERSHFLASPNPNYVSFISVLSFFTYAIFAFGGIEAVGGLVDQTHNAEKTFPKGVAISAIIISIGYSVGIFSIGCFTNWSEILASDTVNTANVTYVTMNHLGYSLGNAFGLADEAALLMGRIFARITGLSMFCALTGAFFTLIYSPLKQLIEGCPKHLLPEKLVEIKDGMPFNAMMVQGGIVAVLILLVSFGGDNASAFFNKLVTMTNVAMTIPYMFLSIAFIFFKKKESIKKPFEIYKTSTGALVATIVVTVVVGMANIFSIIEPAMNGKLSDTIFAGGGPLLFALIAYLLYLRYEKNYLRNNEDFKVNTERVEA